MASRYWTKFHVARLDDPTIATLPDSSWRRLHECYLLAKDTETGDPQSDGFIPPLALAAWRVHVAPDVFEGDLARLARVGLMELRPHPDGADRWFVSDYPQTQAREPDAERKRQERARAQKQRLRGDRHDVVTNRDTDQEEEEEIEGEREREAAAAEPADFAAAAPHPLLETFQELGISLNTKTRRIMSKPDVTPDIVCETLDRARARARAGLIDDPVSFTIKQLIDHGAAAPRMISNPGGRRDRQRDLDSQIPPDLEGIICR